MIKEKQESPKRKRFDKFSSFVSILVQAVCMGMIAFLVVREVREDKKNASAPIENVVPVRTDKMPQFTPSGTGVWGAEIHLLYFWAEWCGPCRKQGPVVDEVASRYQSRVSLAKIDIDQRQSVARQYGVTGVPCLLLLKDGKEVIRLYGYTGEKRLRAAVKNALDSGSRP